ncbi:MAG TPA: NAD-dependent deacylase [Bacteroidales bacterium]|jgi:NAD-dependent deacetylase|nr:NAD-dependent deacylase [Bacteroidales bacterium]
MKHLVVLTGAGISSESGIKTFRDSGGLWEEYDIADVATPEAWYNNRDLVLRFYNERRRQLKEAKPNKAHTGLAFLENHFEIDIITQNIDNLHERAGSTNILHLHGELTKARSSEDPSLIYNIGYKDINPGDFCDLGSQLRPHVVWFGEEVPNMEEAITITSKADIFVVIGTSLNVYPAAGLINYVPGRSPIYVIDPANVPLPETRNVQLIRKKAGEGVRILTEYLVTNVKNQS